MVTSPLCETARKVFQRASGIQALSTALLTPSAGRILLKGTPSKGTLFRYDPYKLCVLESREYPTPCFTRAMPLLPPTPTFVQLNPAPSKRTAPQQPLATVTDTKKFAQTVKPVVPAPQEEAVAMPTGPQCRVLVEFKRGEDVYESSLSNHSVGDIVLVEGDRGVDIGKVVEILPVKGPFVAKVMSIAQEKEKEKLATMRKEEAAAATLCQQRVREHNLKMKIEDIEFQYDGGKITIYYSANCAIDFRQLQRQLFRDFRCRVWFTTVPASS